MRGTGIGPALRKARIQRGKSLEEASRETRIRAEYLTALEQERFEALLGEVYVRGFLRSYSSYLGLDPDKVLSIYSRHFGPPESGLPEAPEAPARSPKVDLGYVSQLRSHHLSWGFLLAVALVVIGIFAAAGWFSRSKTAPASANVPSPVASVAASPSAVTVDVLATVDVRLQVVVDGLTAFDQILRGGEGQAFDGEQVIAISLDKGATAIVTVNGFSLGAPGTRKEPYSATFGPQDYRDQPTPSPSGGCPSPGASPSSTPSSGVEATPTPTGGLGLGGAASPSIGSSPSPSASPCPSPSAGTSPGAPTGGTPSPSATGP